MSRFLQEAEGRPCKVFFIVLYEGQESNKIVELEYGLLECSVYVLLFSLAGGLRLLLNNEAAQKYQRLVLLRSSAISFSEV